MTAPVTTNSLAAIIQGIVISELSPLCDHTKHCKPHDDNMAKRGVPHSFQKRLELKDDMNIHFFEFLIQ